MSQVKRSQHCEQTTRAGRSHGDAHLAWIRQGCACRGSWIAEFSGGELRTVAASSYSFASPAPRTAVSAAAAPTPPGRASTRWTKLAAQATSTCAIDEQIFVGHADALAGAFAFCLDAKRASALKISCRPLGASNARHRHRTRTRPTDCASSGEPPSRSVGGQESNLGQSTNPDSTRVPHNSPVRDSSADRNGRPRCRARARYQRPRLRQPLRHPQRPAEAERSQC